MSPRKSNLPPPPMLGAIPLIDFLEFEFEPEKPIVGETIVSKSIGMLAGPRGIGKTWLSMALTYAAAGAKPIRPWGTGAGVPVAYLDGEMRAPSLQSRWRSIHALNTKSESIEMVKRNLRIISRDCMGSNIGFIDTEDGQKNIDALIPEDVALIVIDNLSAWTRGGREDSAAWALTKGWLIKKRMEGTAVLLIHHTGKNGQQRGSSAHEDLLDYSILLRPLASSKGRDDTRFSIEHTKVREHFPILKQRQEFTFWTENDVFHFKCVPAEYEVPSGAAEMVALQRQGLSMAAIGKKLGVSKSTVSRTLEKTFALLEDEDSTDAD
jgi:hypothetical protein